MADMVNGLARRAPAIVCAGTAIILTWALVAVSACGRQSSPPFEIDGVYRASVIDRESPAMDVFFTIHPEAKENNVPSHALVVKIEFSGEPSPPVTDCQLHVLVPHASTWQLSGSVDQLYGNGIDPAIGQLLERHPEIPQSRDDTGNRVFEGTVFVTSAVAQLPPLVAMWLVSGETSVDTLRVGVASSCSRRLRDFRWLSNSGPFER